MIKFIIDKIHLRNVRNYGDDGMDMDFPLGNLTVFTGHVGAGKSTILKSVSMALYGDDGGVKGEKLSIDDMVNERTGKNLEIELFFHSINTLNNNERDDYEIHLYHKHAKYQNKLIFIKNGKDISANGKMDTYRLIEKTIIPKDVYHNIYYFTQQAKNFFTALPNSEQKAIFDSILDLSDYDHYYENCRNQISQYEKIVEECDLKVKMYESSIEDKTKMLASIKENIDTLIKQHKETMESLQLQSKQLHDKLKSIEDESILDSSSKDITIQINELNNQAQLKLSQIDNEIKSLMQQLTEVNSKMTSDFEIEKAKATQELQPKVDEINGIINNLKMNKNNTQSDYKNKVDSLASKYQLECKDIESTISEKLNELSIKHNDIISAISQLKAKADGEIASLKSEATKKKSDYQLKIADLNSKCQRLENEKNKASDSESKLRDIIKNNQIQLNSETPHCDKCGQALVNVDHLRRENEEAETKASEFAAKISEYVKDIDICHSEIDTINSDIQVVVSDFKTAANKIIEEFGSSKSKLENDGEKIKADKEILRQQISKKKDELKSAFDANNAQLTAEVKKTIDEIDNDIEKNNQNLQSLISETKQKLAKFADELKKASQVKTIGIQDNINDFKKKKSDIIQETDSKLAVLETNKKNAENRETVINNLKNDIINIAHKIELESEFVPDRTSYDNVAESRKKDIAAMDKNKKDRDENAKVLEVLNFWKTAFSDSGIKSMLIDVAIPHMNRCVKEELDRVCPGTFTVSFDTLSQTKSGTIRDKFAINIIHNLKCATGHKKLSGGEKRIIDFCCMSALRSLAESLYGKMFCHIFYDEVLDSLDSECRELFCRSMKTQSSDERHVLLVTHALTEDVEPDRVFPF